ncbi:MAG: DUF89 family protein [Lentisphaerae bacterium]|nr:DUF89 family protein [Lentisphaerota bacterium]
MNTAIECIPCFVRQAAEAVEMSVEDKIGKEHLLRRLLAEIAESDWSVMPVKIAQMIQRTVRNETGQSDPYRALKDLMNRTALDLLPVLTDTMRLQQNPLDAVTRLAIAGNLLDAGAKTRLDPNDLQKHLNTIWDAPMAGSPEDLFRAANKADRILYLADNAGEIVFDRLLIEALPTSKITVAVRGLPVINDATLIDAKTAGITQIVPVIANGSDAPGTLIEECSKEFRSYFNNADLIISKGQGNYETLSDMPGNIFFLLTVKCPMIAADIGAPIGSLVVKRGKNNKS